MEGGELWSKKGMSIRWVGELVNFLPGGGPPVPQERNPGDFHLF